MSFAKGRGSTHQRLSARVARQALLLRVHLQSFEIVLQAQEIPFLYGLGLFAYFPVSLKISQTAKQLNSCKSEGRLAVDRR